MTHRPQPDNIIASLGGVSVGNQYPVRIMGIVNVSPESFYKGSVSATIDSIKRIAEKMTREGADFLDVGARSTAPYLKTDISIEEEAERMARAVNAIKKVSDLPISADTKYSFVAEAALQAGAAILNDVSGLANDDRLAAVAQKFDGVIVMANSEYTDKVGDPVSVVKFAIEASLNRAVKAGINLNMIVIDPGIGFFRDSTITWDEWDRTILNHVANLRCMNRPILVSASRKSFIGKVLGYKDPADRLYGSLGLVPFLVERGVQIIRTHDVQASRDVIRMSEWLLGAGGTQK